MTIPESLIREADKIARAEGRTRSELFREAVRRYIAESQPRRKNASPLLSRLAALAREGPDVKASDIDSIIYEKG